MHGPLLGRLIINVNKILANNLNPRDCFSRVFLCPHRNIEKDTYMERIMAAKFTGTEMILATAALEVIKSLLTMIGNKLDNSEGSDIEAMEQVLESMKKAIDLERKIKEAQDEVENNDIDLNDWIDDE